MVQLILITGSLECGQSWKGEGRTKVMVGIKYMVLQDSARVFTDGLTYKGGYATLG